MILAWAAVAAVTILAAIACGAWGHVRYKDGYEAGTLDAQSKANLKLLRERSALLERPAVPREFRQQPDPWFPAVTVAAAPRHASGTVPRLGPGTVPIRHVLTETGGFKADTDQFIMDMQAGEAAWREENQRKWQEISA